MRRAWLSASVRASSSSAALMWSTSTASRTWLRVTRNTFISHAEGVDRWNCQHRLLDLLTSFSLRKPPPIVIKEKE